MKYSIGAYKKYETIAGDTAQDLVTSVDARNETEAVNIAKKLYDEGVYSQIYISYAHPEEAQCYYNPVVGHDSCGVDWTGHFDEQ